MASSNKCATSDLALVGWPPCPLSRKSQTNTLNFPLASLGV